MMFGWLKKDKNHLSSETRVNKKAGELLNQVGIINPTGLFAPTMPFAENDAMMRAAGVDSGFAVQQRGGCRASRVGGEGRIARGRPMWLRRDEDLRGLDLRIC